MEKMRNKKRYTVCIGNKTTRINHPKNDTVVFFERQSRGESDITANVGDFNEGNHNYSGLKGWLVKRAVEKLYGKKCFWFGDYDNLSCGLVFVDMGGFNSSRTGIISISVDL
jgi:hypothetical protein